MSLSQNPIRDAQFSETKALPNGAASTSTTAFDLLESGNAYLPGAVELEIVAPALVVGDLADTETMIYKIEDSADNSSFATVGGFAAVITQTGAGGAGAATATEVVRLPADVRRYVRVTATNSAAGDASDKSMTAAILF